MAKVISPVGAPTIGELVDEFRGSLRARNRSPKTIKGYCDSATMLGVFLADKGMPTAVENIAREHVEAFIVDQLERWTPSTAATRFRCLQQFFKWLDEEGEIVGSPMAKMKPPTVPVAPVPIVRLDAMRKLLKSCDGRGFDNWRDAAILRLFHDSGMRLAELAGLGVGDIDFSQGVAHVTGKGGKQRNCPFGNSAATALRRYLRERRRHSRSGLDALWLGSRGALTDSGVAQMLERRCAQAGLPKLHPHQLRHTSVHEFLSDGGSETDAMRIYGWSSRQMLDRYGASAADERARSSFHRLSPGDKL